MRLSLRCSCAAAARIDASAPSPGALPDRLQCPACGTERPLRTERAALASGGGLPGCLACGHPELYTRKGFPAAAGILVVVAAAALAPFTRYLSLVAAALIDLGLYAMLPDVVVCYVCGAEHRGFPADPRHPRFDREIEERLRYGSKAVMGRPMRPGGTAGAPDPEH